MSNSSGNMVPLLGRMLMCWIFIYSAIGQIQEFNYWVGRATGAGIPLGHVAIIGSITIQLVGGIALLLGAWARFASWVIFFFLIPTTYSFHKFWLLSGDAAIPQINNFNRNLAIMGGLLFVATFGAGAYSIDAMRAAKRSPAKH